MTQSACFILAAPSSNSGKTTLTLALLRYFRNNGLTVKSFKIGPDYIDPAFHMAASDHSCPNIDGWAMTEERQKAIFKRQCKNADLVIGEGVMGLFDGAQDGSGSTADVAERLGIPVILIVNAKGQSQSVAALVSGFTNFRKSITIPGVIFNNVGSDKHRQMLQSACDDIGVTVFGFVPADPGLALKERHLGLVQAAENSNLEAVLENAARIVGDTIDCNGLLQVGLDMQKGQSRDYRLLPAIGKHIAVARDQAFSFIYPHLLEDWLRTGIEISFFSPLEDEAPQPDADAIYLPGGYPELHVERLSNCSQFMNGLRIAAQQNVPIYGECGGYMVLGKSLTTADGTTWPMAGLLPVETSFATRKLHLGYRNISLNSDCVLGPAGARFKAHEFHYCSTLSNHSAHSLFKATNANGEELGTFGAIQGSVIGSFLHLIDGAG